MTQFNSNLVPEYETPPQLPQKKFYQKTWFIVLLLILFWPVGLFLMWKYADWSKIAKIVVTVIIGLLTVIGFATGGDEVDDQVNLETTTVTTTAEPKTTEAETETTTKATTKKAETEITKKKAKLTDNQIVTFLNSSSDAWSGEWKAQDDGFFVFYPEGDLADAFSMLAITYSSTGTIPAEMEDSFNIMVTSMKELSTSVEDTAGKPCSLSIVNPANTDNILLTFMSGEVLYNAFQ